MGKEQKKPNPYKPNPNAKMRLEKSHNPKK